MLITLSEILTECINSETTGIKTSFSLFQMTYTSWLGRLIISTNLPINSPLVVTTEEPKSSGDIKLIGSLSVIEAK